MKVPAKFAAAALGGGISIAGLAYGAKVLFGLGGSSTSLAFEHGQHTLTSSVSVPEPENLLLLGAGLLALAWWHHRSTIAARLLR